MIERIAARKMRRKVYEAGLQRRVSCWAEVVMKTMMERMTVRKRTKKKKLMRRICKGKCCWALGCRVAAGCSRLRRELLLCVCVSIPFLLLRWVRVHRRMLCGRGLRTLLIDPKTKMCCLV